MDINQRYDILGERLADRHQELRNILENMRSYLQNMQEFLTWIDLKELDLNVQGGLPTSEREAKKQLKEHQVREPAFFFLEGSKTQTELCRSLMKAETQTCLITRYDLFAGIPCRTSWKGESGH